MITKINKNDEYIDLDSIERIEMKKYLVFVEIKGEMELYDFCDTEIEAYKSYREAVWNKKKYIALADTKCVELLGSYYLDTYEIKEIIIKRSSST